jgi:hypothetical protein
MEKSEKTQTDDKEFLKEKIRENQRKAKSYIRDNSTLIFTTTRTHTINGVECKTPFISETRKTAKGSLFLLNDYEDSGFDIFWIEEAPIIIDMLIEHFKSK